MREPEWVTEEFEEMTPDQFVAAVKALQFRKPNIVQAAAAVLFRKMGVLEAAEKYGCKQPQVSHSIKRIREKLEHMVSPASPSESMELACFLLKSDQLQLVRKIEEGNLKLLLGNKDSVIEKFGLQEIFDSIAASAPETKSDAEQSEEGQSTD